MKRWYQMVAVVGLSVMLFACATTGGPMANNQPDPGRAIAQAPGGEPAVPELTPSEGMDANSPVEYGVSGSIYWVSNKLVLAGTYGREVTPKLRCDATNWRHEAIEMALGEDGNWKADTGYPVPGAHLWCVDLGREMYLPHQLIRQRSPMLRQGDIMSNGIGGFNFYTASE